MKIWEFRVRGSSGHFRLSDEVAETVPVDHASDIVEHYVPVEWINTIPLEQAVKENGLISNQNNVAKPEAKKWVYIVDRRKSRFGIRD